MKFEQSLSDTFVKLQQNLQLATNHLDRLKSAPCIELFNTICVFPETGLVIDLDESGHPKISNVLFAPQFAPHVADQICANVKNLASESPVKMTPVQYYTLQVRLLNESIDLFTNLLK